MDLKGKRVLITGGARRLGRAVVLHLSQKGSDVLVHYHRSKKDAESLRTQASCRIFEADFSSISFSELQRKLEELGEIDILINNASTFQRSPWQEVPEELWDEEIAVNLKIPFFLCRFYGPRMKKRGAGKIINLADIAAQKPYLNYLPYSIAKSGIVTLTHALARTLAPEVQINAIAPGTILFPEDMNNEMREKVIKNIPAGRTATVDEFLKTIDFLLSDVDYITGQTIVLDGGRSL